MKKKVLFLAVSALLLLVPMLATNVKPNQRSELNNAYLAEFPALQFNGFRNGLENYVKDRIGFRTGMITVYQNFCYKTFQKLVHPNFIYGKDKHFVGVDLTTYQHLDVSEEFVDDFSNYVGSLKNLCQSRGTEFLFYLCPNKETVYPEYFPDGYNIKDQPNRTELILEHLDEKGVAHLDPKELFLSLKDHEQLYYEYDSNHWNQTGTFYGQQQIIHYLNGKFPEMGELERDEFEVTQILQPYLMNTRFRIDEMVPQYNLISTDAVKDDRIFDQIVRVVTSPDAYYGCYQNETAMKRGAPSVLIFGDSYFSLSTKFYLNHCREVVMLHTTFMPSAEYYISVFQPDIVIYEVVERALLLNKWDDFKKEKRCYDLNAAINDESLSVEQIYLDANFAVLKADATVCEIVSFSGNLGEDTVMNPSGVLALKAVLNGKEYDPIFDRDALSYHFSFRAEDIAAASEISFFALREGECQIHQRLEMM